MAAEKTITVAPGSELARLLEEAGDATLVLEKDGVRYRLGREAADGFTSPQEFYEEATQRADVRDILSRLAR